MKKPSVNQAVRTEALSHHALRTATGGATLSTTTLSTTLSTTTLSTTTSSTSTEGLPKITSPVPPPKPTFY
jgi:hypothetical protein